MDYAVFRTGGKQYRAGPGAVIDVEKLPAQPGSVVELGDVLAVSQDGDLTVGKPLIAGARVLARVVEQGRDKKVLVFKYKRKTRYRRKRGHRQPYTRLAIQEVLLEGEEPTVATYLEDAPASGALQEDLIEESTPEKPEATTEDETRAQADTGATETSEAELASQEEDEVPVDSDEEEEEGR